MKKMNIIKGLAAGLITVCALGVNAQTDTTRKDTTRQDTTRPGTDSVQMQQATHPKQDYTIVDLYTMQPIDVYYDTVSYKTINRTSSAPVDFYVINGVDTVHGATGLVVNGMLVKGGDGKFKLDEGIVKVYGDEIKMKMNDGRKVKWENGKMKVKEWGEKRKTKADKEKMKNEWSKVKWKDGEWKVEKDS